MFQDFVGKYGNLEKCRRVAHGLLKNKNKLNGLANCKKTTTHHSHLLLCAKSKKTNDAKSRKWPKTLISTFFFRGQISPNCKFFLKNRFHSNWRSYLVLTSDLNPKKWSEPFLRKLSVSDFGLIWRPFCEYLQINNFF